MRKIGFKIKSSVSKWEKSYYGGYYRMISDYPKVVIDMNVDFEFAPIKKRLSNYEKEKLLKIFLSRSKTNSLLDYLMIDAETSREESLNGAVIKTVINEAGKTKVLNELCLTDGEYAPMFKHYKKFITDSEISFKRPDNSENKQDQKNQQEKQDQQNNQDKQDQQGQQGQQEGEDEKEKNDEKSDNKNDGQDKNDGQNKNEENDQQPGENNDDGSSKNNNQQKQNELNYDTAIKNISAFLSALKNISEEELFKYDFLSNFTNKTKVIIREPSDSEVSLTDREIDIAEKLTNMLDISFDPAEDTVKNLRIGKLDAAKIAEIPAGNISVYTQKVEDQTTKPFSVVILCDESGSMHGSKLQSQYEIVKSLYLSFSEILPQEKIFVYGHTGKNSPDLYVYQDAYNPNFMTTINKMFGDHHGWNYDGPVIEEVHKLVRASTDDRIIFIVMSDGYPNGHGYGREIDHINMRQIIEKCKRDEFVTVGIGIREYYVKGLYQYSTVVDDLNDMPKKVSYIVNHVVKTEFQ